MESNVFARIPPGYQIVRTRAHPRRNTFPVCFPKTAHMYKYTYIYIYIYIERERERDWKIISRGPPTNMIHEII